MNQTAESLAPSARSRAWKVFLLGAPYYLLLPIFARFVPRDVMNGPVSSVFYDVAMRVGLPFLCWSVMRRRAGITFSELGFPPRIRGRYTWGEFAAWAFISTLCCMIYLIIARLVMHGLDTPRPDGLAYIGPHAGVQLLFTLTGMLLVTPFAEELFYRGVLGFVFLSASRSVSSRLAFVLVSALLFGNAHFNQGWPGMIGTTYFGAVAAIFFIFTRNIWLVIVPHFFSDYIAAVEASYWL